MTFSINEIINVDYFQHTTEFPENTIRVYVKAKTLDSNRIISEEFEEGKIITPNDVVQIIVVEPTHSMYDEIIEKFNPQKTVRQVSLSFNG